MTTSTFYTRQMLMQYGRQLVAARRLARYEQLLGRGSNAHSDESAERRRMMVERIAREITDNLIFSGSKNPIVQLVLDRLCREMGENFTFRYPPAEHDFQIFRTNTDGNEEQLSTTEKKKVLVNLWDITLRTVDETML